MLLKVFIILFFHLLQQGVCYDAFLWKSSAVYDECLPLWLFTFPASVNLDIDLITTCSKISTIQPHLISIWYWSHNYPFQNKRHTTLFEEQHHLMKAIWLFIVSAFFQVSYRSFISLFFYLFVNRLLSFCFGFHQKKISQLTQLLISSYGILQLKPLRYLSPGFFLLFQKYWSMLAKVIRFEKDIIPIIRNGCKMTKVIFPWLDDFHDWLKCYIVFLLLIWLMEPYNLVWMQTWHRCSRTCVSKGLPPRRPWNIVVHSGT